MSDSLQSHDCSTPGLSVHYKLQEFTQTHVHWVGDAIQPSHLLSEVLQFFNFCHKGGVICISEVIDIYPGNLDSSLCFIQPSISNDALWYKLNKKGDNMQPWHTPFRIWNQSVVPCPVLTVASWPAYRFLRMHVRWSGIPSLSEFSTVCCDPQPRPLA